MSIRSELLAKFFEIAEPDVLISNTQRSKAILMDLGMNRKDINLILSIIESHPNLIKRQLFEIEALDVDKDAVVNSLSKDSYFTKGAVRSLVNDLCMALETTRSIDVPIVRDGCSYYGEWNHGKPHGKGVLIDALGNFI